MHSESLSSPCTSLNYNRLAFPVSWAPCDHVMWLAPMFTKQRSNQVPESGDTFQQSAFLRQFTIMWRTLQSSNIPPYQLFQNIMRPKNQLVNPPKMKKFNSICAFSGFLLQLWTLKLGQLANQSGSSRHMTCKMAGNGPSRQGSHADIGRRAWLTVTWCKMLN